MPDSDAYRAARESTAVFDLIGWTWIELTGNDARTFLHNFCTSDVKKLPDGGGCESFLTNVKARVVGHGFVFETSEQGDPTILELATSPGQEAKLVSHLDRYVIREDVAVSGRSSEVGTLFVTGPDAADRLAAAGVRCGQRPADLEPFRHLPARVEGAAVRCYRTDLLGGPGYLLQCPAEAIADVQGCLGSVGLVPGDAATFDALRIEACFPLAGVDVTEDHLAPEVGRPWAISYTKGCYLGQEPIARIDALGHVNRLLRGLRVESAAVPVAGAAVTADGKEVGTVTSAAVSPGDGRAAALAYLRTKFAEPGTAVVVDTPAGPAAATVYGPPVV